MEGFLSYKIAFDKTLSKTNPEKGNKTYSAISF